MEFKQGHPLAQRRGRALHLPPPRRGQLRPLPVQPDPQGGAEPAARVTATASSRTGGWWCSAPRRTSRRACTRCRCGRRRSSPPSTPPPRPRRPGYLGKVGNAELVRGISDALTLQRIAKTEKPTRRIYEDLIAVGDARGRRVLLARPRRGGAPGAHGGAAPHRRAHHRRVREGRRRCRSAPSSAITEADAKQATLMLKVRPEELTNAEAYMQALTELRQQRGPPHHACKEIRYIDLARVEALEKQVIEETDRVSAGCVDFFQKGEALPAGGRAAGRAAGQAGAGADDDRSSRRSPRTSRRWARAWRCWARWWAACRWAIRWRARRSSRASPSCSPGSTACARASRSSARSWWAARSARSSAPSSSCSAQNIESALVGGRHAGEVRRGHVAASPSSSRSWRAASVSSTSSSSPSPRSARSCSRPSARKKQALVDERQRRAQNLFSAAERILVGVQRRAKSFKSDDELNTYFASDAMVQKLRQLAEQLMELQDSVRADEVLSRVKTRAPGRAAGPARPPGSLRGRRRPSSSSASTASTSTPSRSS